MNEINMKWNSFYSGNINERHLFSVISTKGEISLFTKRFLLVPRRNDSFDGIVASANAVNMLYN